MLIIKNLSKKFDSFWAVKDLNIRIKRGEFYCLLGPNGAGKTTTLKIICGLMKPTQGKVFINGWDVEREYIKVKRILGVIPDTPFLYENLTPQEFIEFIGDIFKIERKRILEKRDYYFQLFNLAEYKDVLIRELSHGMRQKLVYISNFIHSPLIYLIDEPLVGLDPYTIYLIKKILKGEVKEGKTILMCTHILSIAEELGSRIGILRRGELIAEGTLKDLKDKFSTTTLEEIFLKII